MMKKALTTLAAVMLLGFVLFGAAGSITSVRLRAQAPAAQAGARPEKTAWYFYRVKWGFQDEFVRLFTGMLSRVWLRTLKTGKRITYTGETVGATRATVRTTIALERQGQVHVEYHLLPSGNTRWRVHDVLVDRRSLVTGYREYFDKALAGSSYQDLIWKLRLKEVELSPAAASA